MYQLAKPFFITCETPLHAGSGSDLGVIDLPIQRERHTSYPKIESSSLKGSIRQSFEEKYKENKLDIEEDKTKKQKELIKIHQVFGYDDAEKNPAIKDVFKGDEGKFASAISFTDARILLFPVKSMVGVFAWITCADVLNKFIKEMKIVNKAIKYDKTITDENKAIISTNSKLKNNNKIFLEEYTFETEVNKNGVDSFFDEISKLIYPNDTYFQEEMKNRIVILSNNDFKDFVNLSTEVVTRTKIDNETGTVKDGALFNEEYLPSESVLYSLVMASPIFNKKGRDLWGEATDVMDFFETIDPIIQIGGNMTLGKGISRIVFDKTEVKK